MPELPALLRPLGHRKDGSPFWLYIGADGTDGGDDDGGGDGDADGEDGDEDGDDEDDGKVGNDGLNAKGRKALDAERAAADRARRRYLPYAKLAKETGLTIDEMRARLAPRNGSKGDNGKDEVDAEQIRREATAKANEAVNAKLVKAAVRAEAAAVLTDPKDAIKFLDLSDYEVDEDGEIDAKQIKRDLTALLADKPYLGKARKGDGRGGAPDFDGGPRGGSPKIQSMSDLIRRRAGVIK